MRIELTGEMGIDGPRGRVAGRHLGGGQPRCTLALLVLERHRPVTRDELVDVLWPQRPPATWSTALRGVIAGVRRALVRAGAGDDVLETVGGSYHLHLPDDVWVDVEEARIALNAASAALAEADPDVAVPLAASAVTLLGRPFLPGVDVDWAEGQRRRLRLLLLAALDVLAGAQLRHGDAPAAIDAGQRLLAIDPLSERAYRVLIEAHGLVGDRIAATQTLDRCRATLVEEVGVEPSEATMAAWRAATGEPAVRPTERGGTASGVARLRQAAVRATAERDHPRAAMYHQRVVDLLEDERPRAHALVDLGVSLRQAGDLVQADIVLLRAADTARRRDDVLVLARSAVALADHQRPATRAGPLARRLLEEALAQEHRLPAALRGRLRSAYAEQLVLDGQLADVDSVLGRAAESGRSPVAAAEPEALAAQLAALVSPGRAPERLAAAAKLEGRLDDQPGTSLTLAATGHRIHALVELGDWPAARRAMDDYARDAAVTGLPLSRWLAAHHAAGRAVVEGRFADADALADATVEPGRGAVGEPAATGAALMHTTVVRWLQGRASEVAAPSARIGVQLGWPVRSQAARCLLEVGTVDAATTRQRLGRLLASGEVTTPPHDGDWPATMFYLAAAAAELGAREPAAAVAELLRPHLGRDCTFIGLVYYGAYAHHVGRLMTVCGEAPEAAVHLRGALAHYDAIGALAWSDLARRDLGAAASDDQRSA